MLGKTQPTQATLKEKFAYSTVSFAQALISSVVATFALYYFTDVLLLPAGIVSVVLFVVRFFDGAIDPFIGYWMDGRATKFGKYRGYLFYWALPFCVTFIFLFVPPLPSSTMGVALWCGAIYLLWSFSYSMLEASTLPLLLTLSNGSKDRYSFNAFKIVGSVAAALAARYFTLELVQWFGKGDDNKGFGWMALLLGALCLVLIIGGASNFKEKQTTGNNRFSLPKTFSIVAKDKVIVFLLLFFFCVQMASAVKGQATVYYMKYFVSRADLTSIFMVVGVGSSLLTQPLIFWAAQRAQAGTLACIGCVGASVSMLIMGFARTSLPVLMIGNVLYGVTTAFPANLVYIYTADVANRYIQKKGDNFSAFVNSLLGLSSKLGTSVAGALIALMLQLSAYVPNEAQKETALAGIQNAFVTVAFALYLLAAVFIWLSWRHNKGTGEVEGNEQHQR